MADNGNTLLRVENLKKHFPIMRGILVSRQAGAVKAVDGVDFAMPRGILAVTIDSFGHDPVRANVDEHCGKGRRRTGGGQGDGSAHESLVGREVYH